MHLLSPVVPHIFEIDLQKVLKSIELSVKLNTKVDSFFFFLFFFRFLAQERDRNRL